MFTSHAHIRSQHNRVWPHMSFVCLSTRVQRFLSKCGCIPQWSPSVLGRMKRCSSTYVHDYCPRRSVCHTVRIQYDQMFFLALFNHGAHHFWERARTPKMWQDERMLNNIIACMYICALAEFVCVAQFILVKVCAHKFGTTKCANLHLCVYFHIYIMNSIRDNNL